MANRTFVTLAVGVSTLLMHPLSWAQVPPASGGLFGATRSDVNDRDRLNATFLLAEGYDTELPLQLQASLGQTEPVSGGYSTLLIGSAEYAHTRRRVQVAGTANTAFRYYQQLNSMEAVSHSGGIGANFRLPATASFQVNQSAAYSPSYLYQLFPTGTLPVLGETIPAAPDYRVLRAASYTYRSDMTFSMGTPRGTQVTGSGTYSRTDFENQPTVAPTWTASTARARVSQGMRRNVGLSAAYEYTTGTYGLGGISTEHRLGFGAEYSRALSISRRANFRVNLTPSILEITESTFNDGTAGQVYRMQGDASVDYQFRRTWRASGKVQRGVEYLAVLTEPIFSDAGRLSLEGLLSRRVDLLATAGYATGASVVNGSSQLDTYTGNIRLRFALTRILAIYSEYLYIHYDQRGEQLVPAIPRAFEQHGVRIGLVLWSSVL